MRALGVIDLGRTRDLEADRRLIRRTAEACGLDVADVMTFRGRERSWPFAMLEAVHRFGAHAVIEPSIAQVAGFERAVTGVADLIAPEGVRPYVGYGSGHTRPSALDLIGGKR